VSATIRVVVREKPAVAPVANLTVQLGDVVDRTFVASGDPVPAWTTSGLPPGLTVTDLGDGRVRVHGTPTTTGTSVVTLTATSSVGSASTGFTLLVQQAPVFTNAADVELEAGVPASVLLRVDGYPAPTVSAAGLPDGLSVVDHGDGTATISGTPTGGGRSVVRLTATNGAGVTSVTIAATVTAAPQVTSAPVAKVVAGGAVKLTIAAAGFPTPVLTLEPATGAGAAPQGFVSLAASRSAAAALPAGLTFTDNGDGTATIAGTPTTGGRFRPTVVATSASGVARQTLDLTVAAITGTDVEGDDRVVVGDSVDLTFRAGGYPTPVLRVVGLLPPGLTFTDNGDGTGTLRGSATIPGTFVVTIEADNGAVQRFSATIVSAVPTPTPTPPAPDVDEPDTSTPADDDPAPDAPEPAADDDETGEPTAVPDELPRTGASALTSLVVALGAILLGALMVRARRRRA